MTSELSKKNRTVGKGRVKEFLAGMRTRRIVPGVGNQEGVLPGGLRKGFHLGHNGSFIQTGQVGGVGVVTEDHQMEVVVVETGDHRSTVQVFDSSLGPCKTSSTQLVSHIANFLALGDQSRRSRP